MKFERPDERWFSSAVFFFLACCGGIVEAGSPPSLGRCQCRQARTKIAAHWHELERLQERLKDHEDKPPISDQAGIEEQITDLEKLSKCAGCPKSVRSEADLLLAGIEGVLAKDYDSWGTKKGEDGRRSFRATREATRVDPENFAAWTSYGNALAAIAKKTLKSRIAKYLAIDLPAELKTTATNIRRLLAKAPSSGGGARAALAELDKAIK